MLYSEDAVILPHRTKVGTVTVDGWAVTFGTARRGLNGVAARPGPSSLSELGCTALSSEQKIETTSAVAGWIWSIATRPTGKLDAKQRRSIDWQVITHQSLQETRSHWALKYVSQGSGVPRNLQYVNKYWRHKDKAWTLQANDKTKDWRLSVKTKAKVRLQANNRNKDSLLKAKIMAEIQDQDIIQALPITGRRTRGLRPKPGPKTNFKQWQHQVLGAQGPRIRTWLWTRVTNSWP